MRPDPPRNLPGRLGSRFFRNAWTGAFLLGLIGCSRDLPVETLCLQQNNANPDCCGPDGHIDNSYQVCCRKGEHAVADFEHLDWVICIADADAGTDAEADAGTDAP
jgi:hypothetical protein